MGFSQLANGYYKVVSFRLVKNKHYKADSENPGLKDSLLVELKDQVLFLLEYWLRRIGEDETKVNELNSDGVYKYLYFGGKRENR